LNKQLQGARGAGKREAGRKRAVEVSDAKYEDEEASQGELIFLWLQTELGNNSENSNAGVAGNNRETIIVSG